MCLPEWETEPDDLTFEFHGFRCRVFRQSYGHLCGYLAIPEDHPWRSADGPWQKGFWKLNTIGVEVHGGITFSGWLVDEDPNQFWVGFDCAHSNDFVPEMPWGVLGGGLEYRNVAFVKNELQKLALQALNAGKN